MKQSGRRRTNDLDIGHSDRTCEAPKDGAMMISVDAIATAVAGYAPGIIAKATIVLAICGCISGSTTRASAAKRHLLWLCALVSCAALALLAPISRRIVVPMPAFVAAHASLPLAGVTIARDETRHSDPVDATPDRQNRLQDWEPLAPLGWRPAALATIGLAAWLGGFLFITLRFAFAYRSVNAVVRRVPDGVGLRWRASLARVTDRRDIRVRVGGEASSPFTFGVARPTIVLPADADDWSDERRVAVLRHEVAHIERGDVATQTIGLLVCALFWFHPLAWFAVAQMRHESERAADDRVISAGMSSIAYAAHLVEIAGGVNTGRSVPAVAVAIGMPPLERRIRAILDRNRSRGGVPRRVRAVGMCMAFAAMVPISGVELVETVQPRTVTIAHRAADPLAASRVNVPNTASPRMVKVNNARPLPVRRHAVVVATTVSTRAETASPARPFHIGGHPDF
jgi:bla regulator protein BlaR1